MLQCFPLFVCPLIYVKPLKYINIVNCLGNRNKCKVSKSGRHTDTRLRKIFHNLLKILAFKRKTVKLHLLT